MNFYNPYLYSMPVEAAAPSLLSRFSFSSLINGASRTLNLVNQAIPVVKQMSPMMKNLKTMFSVMNEFKKNDLENSNVIKDAEVVEKVERCPICKIEKNEIIIV